MQTSSVDATKGSGDANSLNGDRSLGATYEAYLDNVQKMASPTSASGHTSSSVAVKLIGFGGRAPSCVLELIRSGKNHGWVHCVLPPVRSAALGVALLDAPYRMFCSRHGLVDEAEHQQLLVVYCLPTSLSEYWLNGVEEMNQIRAHVMKKSPGNVVVACYYPSDNGFAFPPEDIWAAFTEDRLKNILHSSLLHRLALFDKDAAHHFSARQHSVLVVGSGGREHALAVALAQSPLVEKVICCPGNAGTAKEGGKVCNTTTDDLISYIQQHHIDMVVIGPEGPLVDGFVNSVQLRCPQTRVFGPTKEAAQLEASKAFTKDFLKDHNIPTATYQNFTDVDEALDYVEKLFDSSSSELTPRVVVKASGLAAGKGVLLPLGKEQTLQAVAQIMQQKQFGSAGDTCVIEEYLEGPEASCLAFCDGKTAKLMPAAQDHKRALDNDEGLNTGGMGAYTPAPCVTPVLHQQIEQMCIQTVQQMARRGTPYVGILYAGVILTPRGPQILEFNCRFGDPETQVLLPLLENDLYEVMCACCDGTLSNIDVRFKENLAATTVVCAAKGYPEAYPTNMQITGLSEAAQKKTVKVYHAGTKLSSTKEQQVLCSGGRVLAVTGVGSTIDESRRVAYEAVKLIDFVENGESLIHYRTDIAQRAIKKKLRIGILGSTRGTSLLPIMQACASGQLHAEIVAVVSNKSTAPILEKGSSLGCSCLTRFVSSKGLTREEHDAEVSSILQSASVDLVLLIGYMRILSKDFTTYWSGRCLNVHPSLLPKHSGGMDLAVHQEVIDAGETETGCTIHQVTEEVDGGPIVIQKIVQVTESDTAESLKEKVQPLEGLAFIEAIQKLISPSTISYADAGVSIEKGNDLVERIKPLCKGTQRPGCDAELGGFGGLFDLAAAGYDAANTVLIGATDGVGTKLRVAQEMKKHESVGIDLVAMCVNDLIVAGGEPLFFLDYYATGKLEVDMAAEVVRGIAEGCRQSYCGLIGGETAEMPSMYAPGDYDLAGFSVGAVHRDSILPRNVTVGNILLGLPSSGIHSNGFSLVRKLVSKENLSFHSCCPWEPSSSLTLGDSLLTPTKIYVKSCLPLLKAKCLNGLAHITGGGLLENLPRSLPKGIVAEIYEHPPLPPVFAWMKQVSGLNDSEMLRTFNCGIGMVLIVNKERVDEAKSLLRQAGESIVYELGVLTSGDGEQVVMKHPLK